LLLSQNRLLLIDTNNVLRIGFFVKIFLYLELLKRETIKNL